MEKERSSLKRTILILLGIVIILFLSIFVLYKNNQSSNEEVVEIFKEESVEKDIEEQESLSKEKVRVDIKGMVNNPGVYEVDSTLTVSDVIFLAGGLLENANTSLINLAKKVYDEMIIIIYSNEEVESQKENKECLCDCSLIDNNACFDKEEITDNASNEISLVNINTATIEDLMKLNGVGKAKAKSIIDYRNKNGSFKSIEDIKNVPGIGDSLFEKIKEYITV